MGRPSPWPADRSPAPRLVPGPDWPRCHHYLPPLEHHSHLCLRRDAGREAKARAAPQRVPLRCSSTRRDSLAAPQTAGVREVCRMMSSLDPPHMSRSDGRRLRWAISRQRKINPAVDRWIADLARREGPLPARQAVLDELGQILADGGDLEHEGGLPDETGFGVRPRTGFSAQCGLPRDRTPFAAWRCTPPAGLRRAPGQRARGLGLCAFG